MPDDQCKRQADEHIEAVLKYGEAQHQSESFLPIVTEPLHPTKDIEPEVITEGMLNQRPQARREEAKAADLLKGKADALMECKRVQQSTS